MSDGPAPMWGFRCLACQQRIKPFHVRIPVTGRPMVPQSTGTVSLGTSRLVGFRHPGCSLKAA